MRKEGYKYNWELDKEEFMVSDAINPREFYKKELGVFAPASHTLRAHTSTWVAERRAIREESQKEVQEAITNKKIQFATSQMEKMLQTKDTLINLIKEYFSEGNAWEYVEYTDKTTGEVKKRVKLLISSAEFWNMWRIIKTEVGEPTVIAAESKDTKKLSVPEGGLMGIKELMLKWKSSTGETKQITETTVTSGEVINMNTDGTERTEANTG